MSRKLLALACAVAALTAGCASAGSAGSGDKPVVVATTTQVADIARDVGGSDVSVEQILQPNTDPHEYEPRPGDAVAVSRAKVVLRSGGDVDTWLNGVLDQANTGATVVDLGASVKRRGQDPHWWQDPRNGELATQAVASALAAADPRHAAGYRQRAHAYTTKLKALDGSIARCMASVPTTKRRLVTNHDALEYFAHRYGVTIVGVVIPSLSTAAGTSAGETAKLVKTIRREGVREIFPESSVPKGVEAAVAKEAGAKLGPALYADSLGPKGSPGATYIGSLRFNAGAMADGFSGRTGSCRLP
ncbi:MAG: metal ABC transporter solute-binding protein, Zn/Mn family [Thermoleophilaceae bacterium]